MSQKTILIADDDLVIRETYQDALQRRYDVATASNGEEVLERLASNSIDAVLMDIKMPVMDGIQSLREIRKTKKYKPVIMMSGFNLDCPYSENTTLRQAIEQAGATDFFPKQGDVGVLRQLFEKYLDTKILVVMQHLQIAQLLEHVFDGKYTFDIQSSFQEAKKKLAGNGYALVISGIGSPAFEARGIDFIRHVKQEQPGKKLIVMSGYGDSAEQEALALGADTYVSIPCDIYSIAEKIEEVIRK